MAEEDDASKTEDPTPRRLHKARDRGNVASSQEIKSWMILLGGTFGVVMLSPVIMRDITTMTLKFIAAPHAISMDFRNLQHVFLDMLLDLGLILAPLFGVLFFLALAANIGQTGLVYSPKKIKPELSKISLVKGAKRMFSMRSVVEFVKGILKISIVTFVAFGMTLPLFDDVTLIPGYPLAQSLDRMHEVAIRLAVGTVAVMTVIAVLDFAYQKYTHTKGLRMTKQEIKDEHKQTEGDPMIKARIRKIRMERAQQRMMAAVPEADVVVTNPTHYAVALEYKMDTMPAPKVVAKGIDSMAERIREVAEKHDVPLVENPPLARALYALVELDEEIPPQHFKAVAEIIGYVMRLKGKL